MAGLFHIVRWAAVVDINTLVLILWDAPKRLLG